MKVGTVQERVISVFNRFIRPPQIELGRITPKLKLTGTVLGKFWARDELRTRILVGLEDKFGYGIDATVSEKWQTIANIIAYFEILLSPKERLI